MRYTETAISQGKFAECWNMKTSLEPDEVMVRVYIYIKSEETLISCVTNIRHSAKHTAVQSYEESYHKRKELNLSDDGTNFNM